MQPFENSHANDIDFSLHDFINSGNFEQFMDMFRGENFDPIFAGDIMFNAESINQFNLAPVDIFSLNSMSASDHQMISSLPPISSDLEGGGDENNANDSSDTTTTTPTKRTRVDRSRTLVSERKRRGRMKEKLYALRALVPNITKMDKASIIGDAVSYVHDLQMQAKKLNSEIATLELSLKGQQRFQGSIGNWTKTQAVENMQPICSNIAQMDVFQVEENGYYGRLVCNKGVVVAPALYKALQSLTWVDIQSSNLATTSEQYVLTFTIKVAECQQEINLETIKLWVAGALMNQGFEFKPHTAS